MDTETAIKLAIEKFRVDKYQMDYLDPSCDIRSIVLQDGSTERNCGWVSLTVKIIYSYDVDGETKSGEIGYNVQYDLDAFRVKVSKVDL